MNEPLGIALELAERRKWLSARLSPLARRLAFPQFIEYRIPPRAKPEVPRIAAAETESPVLTARDKAIAAQPQAAVIIAVCARHWDVAPKALYSPSRKGIHVRPRNAACALMREMLALSMPAIGVLLRRDHTTVLHSLRQHAAARESDIEYRRRFDAAVAELRETFIENVATSDTAAAGGERDGCPRQPSPTLPANHGGVG